MLQKLSKWFREYVVHKPACSMELYKLVLKITIRHVKPCNLMNVAISKESVPTILMAEEKPHQKVVADV
jgi:hypothetical protein